jgi:hypothetical protein
MSPTIFVSFVHQSLGVVLRACSSGWSRAAVPGLGGVLALALGLAVPQAHAQDTVCARVKIEIKQELTLERQAFDAEMKISNQLDGASLTDVGVVVKVTDELGVPVAITDDPNNLNAKFFLRVSNKENISNVDGTGTVAASSTATINWLLIPAPGSAGVSPVGKKYLVGAVLQYKFGAEAHTLEVSPDVITVKPLPLLTLDYFLQQDVIADDPLTAEIEPVEPFTLGVRVRNGGHAAAKNLKIDSAQPKIVENNQGLLINFKLTGSYVDDAPAQNTLLINFGDIAPAASKMGRWNMETTLAGKFTEFTARFTHADELGGALTSILQATNAHLLLRDVRVDLPGRDTVRDFLALDGDVVRVYESDGPDTVATDRSAVAQVTAGTNPAGNATYRIAIPPTDGFVYLKLPDPFNGTKALGSIGRSDAKQMSRENVWLSKTRNLVAKRWEYWLNIFDVNTPGVYDTEFRAPPPSTQPPQLQFIPNRTVKEGQQVSFLVEASSPGGNPITLAAAPLPAGARFTLDPPDPQAPGLVRGVFDWTPAAGTAGSYLVTYTASDGTLTGARSASIEVRTLAIPGGPLPPQLQSPAAGTEVQGLRPTLSVLTSADPMDPTAQLQFELYADEALTRLVETAVVDRPLVAGPSLVSWQPAAALSDDTHYWWRARSGDGAGLYSAWSDGQFGVNLYSDAPTPPRLVAPGVILAQNPAVNSYLRDGSPVLSWASSTDRDGDTVRYDVEVLANGYGDPVASVAGLLPGDYGLTRWAAPHLPGAPDYPLVWRVTASDERGIRNVGEPMAFRVHLAYPGNTAPTTPQVAAPLPGSQVGAGEVVLSVHNSSDAQADPLSYVFEVDTDPGFGSADRRASGPVAQGSGSTTGWSIAGLQENRRYYWRARAGDGQLQSAWVDGGFLVNAANDAPPVPTIRHPGHGAWEGAAHPSLQVHPVQEPEGEAVRYEFEVYADAALANRVAAGLSPHTGWLVPQALPDRADYWWRVRALDAHDAASGWSAPSLLRLRSGSEPAPCIQLTAPNRPMAPETVSTPAGPRRQLVLRWECADPNLEPRVSLYYGTASSGYAGQPIVQGIQHGPGVRAGSYAWDVTDLAPGTYYLYAEIEDRRGVGRAYAPGALVVAPADAAGQLVVTVPGGLLRTYEDMVTVDAGFSVRLASAPAADVVVPITSLNRDEGWPDPPQLVFTPQNWAADQRVRVVAQNDCAVDGSKNYRMATGPVLSADPQYIGQRGVDVPVHNVDYTAVLRDSGASSQPGIYVCTLQVVQNRQVQPGVWEVDLKARLRNLGTQAGAVSARITQLPNRSWSIVQDSLSFGNVPVGSFATSTGTITLRTNVPLQDGTHHGFLSGMDQRWEVTVLP